ncbi:hypothetical protein CLV71_12283 [Actinophytocola oryzae]|uniref:Uncharacterized protein n=1 Tax=Actinophytocola oryzae TaxID=502181 RepID=A0A4R7UVC3_9PSEU|nr:hypothetical protein CLV71_12283 [Actinophytocola oryzae]
MGCGAGWLGRGPLGLPAGRTVGAALTSAEAIASSWPVRPVRAVRPGQAVGPGQAVRSVRAIGPRGPVSPGRVVGAGEAVGAEGAVATGADEARLVGWGAFRRLDGSEVVDRRAVDGRAGALPGVRAADVDGRAVSTGTRRLRPPKRLGLPGRLGRAKHIGLAGLVGLARRVGLTRWFGQARRVTDRPEDGGRCRFAALLLGLGVRRLRALGLGAGPPTVTRLLLGRRFADGTEEGSRRVGGRTVRLLGPSTRLKVSTVGRLRGRRLRLGGPDPFVRLTAALGVGRLGIRRGRHALGGVRLARSGIGNTSGRLRPVAGVALVAWGAGAEARQEVSAVLGGHTLRLGALLGRTVLGGTCVLGRLRFGLPRGGIDARFEETTPAGPRRSATLARLGRLDSLGGLGGLGGLTRLDPPAGPGRRGRSVALTRPGRLGGTGRLGEMVLLAGPDALIRPATLVRASRLARTVRLDGTVILTGPDALIRPATLTKARRLARTSSFSGTAPLARPGGLARPTTLARAAGLGRLGRTAILARPRRLARTVSLARPHRLVETGGLAKPHRLVGTGRLTGAGRLARTVRVGGLSSLAEPGRFGEGATLAGLGLPRLASVRPGSLRRRGRRAGTSGLGGRGRGVRASRVAGLGRLDGLGGFDGLGGLGQLVLGGLRRLRVRVGGVGVLRWLRRWFGSRRLRLRRRVGLAGWGVEPAPVRRWFRLGGPLLDPLSHGLLRLRPRLGTTRWGGLHRLVLRGRPRRRRFVRFGWTHKRTGRLSRVRRPRFQLDRPDEDRLLRVGVPGLFRQLGHRPAHRLRALLARFGVRFVTFRSRFLLGGWVEPAPACRLLLLVRHRQLVRRGVLDRRGRLVARLVVVVLRPEVAIAGLRHVPSPIGRQQYARLSAHRDEPI